ncbi:uncharacterized protein [Coffea arabica]|uniref:Integrase catalytic domain-containing protein n=1 Tax=Coffea arabica TaxID=13443 RepID=A0A6P6UZS7_COFAR|nr:uncharacterized protein LOC113715985 [Coffea arabica]
MGHPQANRQAENFNRTLLHGLKTRLHQVRSSWVDELPSVLWSYRTTSRSAIQETPFSLTYGFKAMVPSEFLILSPRMAAFATEINEKERRVDLDLTDEKRDAAAAWVTRTFWLVTIMPELSTFSSAREFWLCEKARLADLSLKAS